MQQFNTHCYCSDYNAIFSIPIKIFSVIENFSGKLKFLLHLTFFLGAILLFLSGCESRKTSNRVTETEQTLTDKASSPDAESAISQEIEVTTVTNGDWVAESLVEKKVVEKLGLDNFFAIYDIDDALFS